MMDDISNEHKQRAASLAMMLGQAKFGTIQSININPPFTARVTLQPGGTLTGWLPLWTPLAGPGWGIFAPPPVGAQVVVIPVDGSVSNGFILPGFFSFLSQAPQGSVGEIWLVHQTGSVLKLTNDGNITIQAQSGGTITLGSNVQVNGHLLATGDVAAGSISLQNHLTSGVTPGTGTSGTPVAI